MCVQCLRKHPHFHVSPTVSLLKNAYSFQTEGFEMRPRVKVSYHTHRRQMTILSTGLGFQLMAWQSQHQRKNLKQENIDFILILFIYICC